MLKLNGRHSGYLFQFTICIKFESDNAVIYHAMHTYTTKLDVYETVEVTGVALCFVTLYISGINLKMNYYSNVQP